MILCRLYGNILQENSNESDIAQIGDSMDSIMQEASPEKINSNIMDKLKNNVQTMVGSIRDCIDVQLPEIKSNIDSATENNADNPDATVVLSIHIPNVIGNFVGNLFTIYSELDYTDKLKTGSDLIKVILTKLTGNANLTPDSMIEYVTNNGSEGTNGSVSYAQIAGYYDSLASRYAMLATLLNDIENCITISCQGNSQESNVAILNISLLYATAIVTMCSTATNQLDNSVGAVDSNLSDYLNESAMLTSIGTNEFAYTLTEGAIGDIGNKILTMIKEFFNKIKNLFKTSMSKKVENLSTRFKAIKNIDEEYLEIKHSMTAKWIKPNFQATIRGAIKRIVPNGNITVDAFVNALNVNNATSFDSAMETKFVITENYEEINWSLVDRCVDSLEHDTCENDFKEIEAYLNTNISAMLQKDDTASANAVSNIVKKAVTKIMSFRISEINSCNQVVSAIESHFKTKQSKKAVNESAILESVMEEANDFCYLLTENAVSDLGKKIWTMLKELFEKFKNLFKTKIQKNAIDVLNRFKAIKGTVNISVLRENVIPNIDVDDIIDEFIATVRGIISRGESLDTFDQKFVGNDDLYKGMIDKFVVNKSYTNIDNKLVSECIAELTRMSRFEGIKKIEEISMNETSQLIQKEDTAGANKLASTVRGFVSELATLFARQLSAYTHIILAIEGKGQTVKQPSGHSTSDEINKNNDIASSRLRKTIDDNKNLAKEHGESQAELSKEITTLEMSIKELMAMTASDIHPTSDRDKIKHQIEEKKAKIAKLKQIKNNNPQSNKEADDRANKNRSNFKVTK